MSSPPTDIPQQGAYGTDAVQGAIHGVIQRVGDRNRKVQEAACSSLAYISEDIPQEALLEQLPKVLQALSRGVQTFGPSGLSRAYDAMDAVIRAGGPAMAMPEHMGSVLPVLLRCVCRGSMAGCGAAGPRCGLVRLLDTPHCMWCVCSSRPLES